MPVPVALQALAYILTAASAVKGLTQDAPEYKSVDTASPAGGGGGQAQNIFTQGQPQSTPQLPAPVAPQANPQAESLIGSIIAGGRSAPQVSPETYYGQGPLMPQGTPPLDPSKVPVPGEANIPFSIGEFLSMSGNVADALGKAAPLLGLSDQQKDRRIATAGAAGGQGGQGVFAMPQRQTLAQILASLPRTM